MVETINNETIEYDSDIYTIVIGAIANYIYLPGLRDVWENIYSCKTPPITVEELLKGTEFAECECFVLQHGNVKHDGRLDDFLVNFFGLDWVTIRIGYDCGGECIEDLYVTIRDGELSPEDTQNVLDLLDSAETFCDVKLYLVGSSWEECDSPGDGDEEKTETALWVTIISRGNT